MCIQDFDIDSSSSLSEIKSCFICAVLRSKGQLQKLFSSDAGFLLYHVFVCFTTGIPGACVLGQTEYPLGGQAAAETISESVNRFLNIYVDMWFPR